MAKISELKKVQLLEEAVLKNKGCCIAVLRKSISS